MGANESLCAADCIDRDEHAGREQLPVRPANNGAFTPGAVRVLLDNSGVKMVCKLCNQGLLTSQKLRRVNCTQGHVFHMVLLSVHIASAVPAVSHRARTDKVFRLTRRNASRSGFKSALTAL